MDLDTAFRRPAMMGLLVFSIMVMTWQVIAEFMYGIRLMAVMELVLELYFCVLLYLVWRRPYSKYMALSFLTPLFLLILTAMAHPDTPSHVFIWVLLMPVTSYLLLGRRLGFMVSLTGSALALLAYLFHYATRTEELNPLVLSNILICLSAIWAAMHLYERNRERTTDELRRMATTDELTGLHNRRQLEKVFMHLARAADRQKQVLAVIIMDLDHFKQINDSWGHVGGDQVLVHVSRLLGLHLRGGDWAFRIGGEEFCLFLPMAEREGAMIAAETLRSEIAKHPCRFNGQDIPLTASIGVAIYPDSGRELASLLSLADERMYRAKQQGRNRVIGNELEGEPTPGPGDINHDSHVSVPC